LQKKYGAKAVAQITDLWPQNLIDFNIVKPSNPVVYFLRCVEKKIYKKCDVLIFAAEGAYDYIKEQNWENDIPRSKVRFINNGIDLNLFDYNKEHYSIEDEDLNNSNMYKVVYTGSVRHVNDLGRLLDVAKLIRVDRIKILIWGSGDELEKLKDRAVAEHINNLVFKGCVEKKYVPYITSKADLNIAHNNPSPVFRYGISFNKIFDYMAAGKPILCDFPCKYNPVLLNGAGVSVDSADAEDIARKIEEFSQMTSVDVKKYCEAARKAAEKYEFEVLTDSMLSALS